jgi:hypothetical protein
VVCSAWAGVTGGLADLVDLLVGVGQGGHGRLDQHRDAELGQAGDQAVGVLGGDDQGRVVLGDRLQVRGQPAQLGDRGVRRVVGVLVDGDDLRAGADRVQVLGGRGRSETIRPAWP